MRGDSDIMFMLVSIPGHCHFFTLKKGTSRQRSGKGAIRKKFPLQKNEVGNLIDNSVLILGKHIVSRVSSFLPNRRPLSYPKNKNMKTHIRFRQHKNSTPKHKTNGTTIEVPHWNDQ